MPSRALLTEAQTISAAELTQVLANQGIARASLSAPVTRTSTATPSNTGLETLNVSLLPSSRYRVTFRLYSEGDNGLNIGLTFPSALLQMDGYFMTYDSFNYGVIQVYPDWPNNVGASGATFYNSLTSSPMVASIILTLDILTGSTANTYGTIGVLASQSFSDAGATSISQNSCVEVLKFS